ncbi:thiol-disulfide isomerase/thioredoxin [Salirhabdus euzebyi]|uniref:Thiol-disulfide isomerase/thioredoxin n=1 Tax=Salirhabdus euzebyi TaxID=394506 RepID=A0A841Q373_9BACI|nr:redoxin domain-containing protein [Salirhabdus euzebyi]MBB6452808.1 thiol-disulfide isomerase/thioredoxin [Salirhabdus euzebyi]
MLQRLLGAVVLLVMFGIVIYNFFEDEQGQNNNEQRLVEIEDENFDGVITAYPEAKEASAQVEVNKPAPDFTLETLDGEELTLSDLKGKKVFLNFWATWCTYCLDEMPAMQKIHENYGDEVVIIGLNATGSETSLDKVKSYVDQLGITFPIVLDKDLKVTYDKYQAMGLPTTFFINTKGEIQLERHIGPMSYELMEEKLKELK